MPLFLTDPFRQSVVPATIPSIDPPRTKRTHLWILLLLTAVAGVLRFAMIGSPPLWGDEVLTYSRVCGTYGQMLEILKSDGFGPLHYSAYWLLGQYVKLDPFWMRVIPAGAGTLMVPAMYWLARQMTNRKASLLAAAIACFSAYLMAYSHDAKMYMHFWLMCALHVAALLHWVRSGSRLVWWVWVATGIAAIGLHTWAAVVVAVEGLIFVTALGESWRLAIGDWRSKARTGVPIANDAAIGLTVGAIADSKLNIGDSTHVSQNANRKWQIAKST